MDKKLLDPYIDMLDALYVSDDAEEDMRTLSKSNNDVWYQIALSPEVGYDLRGVAAKVYTLGLWDANGDFTGDLESLKTLRDTGERLVKLGILYAMEAVDNYEYAYIFLKDSDTYVYDQYRKLTGLLTEFQLPHGFPPSGVTHSAQFQRNFLVLEEPPPVEVHYLDFGDGED